MSYTNKDQTLRDSWETPQYILNWASSIVGGFTYDVAATKENAKFPMLAYDTLTKPWTGICWCNPPYGDLKRWTEKALSEEDATVALLIPSPNGESYYYDLIRNSFEIAIIGRIAFIDPRINAPVSGNNRGNSLFILDRHGGVGREKQSRYVVKRDYLKNTFSP